ncbi:reverse transcriptase domain-containing protein [Tanacetum coccineum]|uniref:Reverse transcriptase domain-containing protein n=1 Tax=Tanacetum coccineum TaxID=301880 RepID=A0ABQ4WFW3_9ASTR
MSALANTTPIVTTVTKPTTKEKTPEEADAKPRVNIQEFCEEHYEDILPVIMDKIHRDKRKEVHARLDFKESPKKRRIREGSQNSSARTLSARYHNPSDRLKVRDRLRYNERHVLDRLGTKHGHRGHGDHPRYEKKGRKSESPSSHVSKSGTNDGGHWKSRSKRHKSTEEDDLAVPWICEEMDIRISKASLLGYYFMQQKKYVKDLVKIHNIKQRDGETIEEFMERFKVETGRMKGAPECMRISGFMHRVNNPELTKRLNEHVPKTMEEMMITTTAFITGEAVAGGAGKKKGHTSWRTQDQSKRHASEQRSNFQGQPRMDGVLEGYPPTLQETPKGKSSAGQKQKTGIRRNPCGAIHSLRNSLTSQSRRIVTIRSSILIRLSAPLVITSLRELHKEARVRLENFKVALHPNFLDHEVAIGGMLSAKERMELCSLLKKNLDIFAWKPSDITGVPRSIVEHRLNIWEGYSPVRQKKRGTCTGACRIIVKKARRLKVPGLLQKMERHAGRTNIIYRPRTAVKGTRSLSDFIIEKSTKARSDTSVVETPQEPWTLFTDGSSCVDGSGAGLILTSPEGTEMGYAMYTVLVEILKEKSIQEKEVTTVVEEDGPTWMTPIIEYLKEGTLPGDRKEASKLCIKARQYELLEGILYRRSFLKSWLRCVGPLQANYVIREINEGSCVAMDYFTKWIEAKAVATITGNQVKKFMWDNIVCRFGLPREIVSDNGKLFSDNPFKDWCDKLDITQRFASAHRTMIKSSHGDTPFSLTYGTEAVIPAEIGMPTYRTAAVDAVHNDEELRLNLDLLEERRERAAIREAKTKLKMAKYYNARVCGVTFRPGDFVYRSNDTSHAVGGGKLDPK